MSSSAAYVATQENRSSTDYGDLATTTDSVTVDVTTSGKVLVSIYSNLIGDTTNSWVYASYALSGNNTRAAGDERCLRMTTNFNSTARFGATFLEAGLSSGSTTFKMKYKNSAGTASYSDRRICAVPVGETALAAYVATDSEYTTSSSYEDLATTTDTVTATIGDSGQALVLISANMAHTSTGVAGYCSYAISGANSRSAEDQHAIEQTTGDSNGSSSHGAMFLETGLSAGSTTFKMKYRTSGGWFYTGHRRIAVIPIG